MSTTLYYYNYEFKLIHNAITMDSSTQGLNANIVYIAYDMYNNESNLNVSILP